MADDRRLFENEDWRVLESGLEHRMTGYHIARDELASRRPDGTWSWPLHMAEKSWCTLPAFMEAFTCAAALYGVATDADLARSFTMARREIATCDPEWAGAGHEPSREDLRWDGAIPNSVEPARNAPARSAPDGFASWPDRERNGRSIHGHGFLPRPRDGRAGRDPVLAAHRWAALRIRRAGTQIVRLLRAALSFTRAYSAG